METETVVVNAPDQIWLCVGNLSDSLTETVEFDELRSGGDISWCNEQIEHWDVRYVRADLYETQVKDSQALLKLLAKDREEVERLKAMLVEAADDIADWGGYAPEYFREKHKLCDDIRKYREAGGVTK